MTRPYTPDTPTNTRHAHTQILPCTACTTRRNATRSKYTRRYKHRHRAVSSHGHRTTSSRRYVVVVEINDREQY